MEIDRRIESYPMSFSHTIDELSSTSHAKQHTIDELSSTSHAKQTQSSEMSNNFTFLEVLHSLLEGNCNDKEKDIISWNVNGSSFRIRDVQRFERDLLPAYFGSRSDYCAECGEKRKPLENYDAFSRQLESYSFHRISVKDFSHETYSHPLFIRGKSRLAEQSAKTWPMPSLSSSGKTRKASYKYGFLRLDKHLRSRACRASATIAKKKTSSIFRRKIKHPPAVHSVDKKQYSLSLKETLLRRKATTALERQNEPELSIVEMLCDIPSGWWYDGANVSNDDFEPLRLGSSNDLRIDSVCLTDKDENSPSQLQMNRGTIDHEDPLDPNIRHLIDHFLHDDIIEDILNIS